MNDITDFDADEEWLYQRTATISRKPSEAQIERFCRMVNTAVVDGGVDLASARRLSFGEVMA